MTRSTVRYGDRHGQRADLWMPESAPDRDVPVVVLIHGGFWRAQYTKVLMRRMARSVVANGWAAWNIEYRRLGRFGGGGGWPATFADAAAAIDALDGQPGLDLGRVATCGHSAGGLLALWLASRPRLGADAPGGPVRVPVHVAVSLAGVVDVVGTYELGGPDGVVAQLLGGTPATVPERYQCTSPLDHLPLGVPQVLVHGSADGTIPPAMSEAYADAARAAGDDAVFVPVPGASHRDMLRGPGWDGAVEHLQRHLTR